MSQINQDHHHNEESECEDCQIQRRENQTLVQCYEKLSKVNDKVNSLKAFRNQNSSNHSSQINKIGQNIVQPRKSPKYIEQFNFNQISYQLAFTLLERQIKIKKQNTRLHKVIESLMENKSSKKSQIKTSFSHYGQNQIASQKQKGKNKMQNYNDTLDELRNSSFQFKQKKKMKQQSRSFVEDGSTFSSNSNTFTNLQSSALNRPARKTDLETGKYTDLNLWLYNLSPQEAEFPPKTQPKKFARISKPLNSSFNKAKIA